MSPEAEGDRILVVDEDQQVLDLLAKQVLIPLGYDVETESEGSRAVELAISFQPDLIIASLTAPGLSGKDLLVALRSQGIDVPVMVTASEGRDLDAIRAFRLGAMDYLVKPLRETEVVAALERALNEVRLRQERHDLANQLGESNRLLERRVRELTTLYGIGKVVTSTTDQNKLFAKLMEGSMYVSEADMGWMLLQDESTKQLILRAQRNLPAPFSTRMHKPWFDDVTSLVMLSGQALSIHGDGLSQFELAQFCKAALIAPTKVRDQPIGILCVAREKADPFSERDQAMLEAVADYASISLVNARLFQALEARANRLQQAVDETLGPIDIEPSQLSAFRSDLGSVKDQVTGLLEEVYEPGVYAGLEKIASQLEDLLGQLEMTEEKEPSRADRLQNTSEP